jgi:hypothetical protein
MEQSRNCKDRIQNFARIDTVDTVEEHAVGIGYERIDFLQLVRTRESRRRKIWMWGCIGDVALDNT